MTDRRLLRRYLALVRGWAPALAEVRDILVRPPQVEADAAFLFKEAHRLEKRRKGCNRALWSALKVKYLFVSLPRRSLDGKRDLPIFGCPLGRGVAVRGLLAPPPSSGLAHGDALAASGPQRWLATRLDLQAIARELKLSTGIAPRVLRLVARQQPVLDQSVKERAHRAAGPQACLHGLTKLGSVEPPLVQDEFGRQAVVLVKHRVGSSLRGG